MKDREMSSSGNDATPHFNCLKVGVFSMRYFVSPVFFTFLLSEIKNIHYVLHLFCMLIIFCNWYVPLLLMRLILQKVQKVIVMYLKCIKTKMYWNCQLMPTFRIMAEPNWTTTGQLGTRFQLQMFTNLLSN